MSPRRWWALTPPFHPYRSARLRRSPFCATVHRLSPSGVSPASCPAVSGLSSSAPPKRHARGHPACATEGSAPSCAGRRASDDASARATCAPAVPSASGGIDAALGQRSRGRAPRARAGRTRCTPGRRGSLRGRARRAPGRASGRGRSECLSRLTRLPAGRDRRVRCEDAGSPDSSAVRGSRGRSSAPPSAVRRPVLHRDGHSTVIAGSGTPPRPCP